MSYHPTITMLHTEFKKVFPNFKFEYAKEGDFEKGNEVDGVRINPVNGWNYSINAKDIIFNARLSK